MKTLKQIYPPFLLAMMLSVQLTAILVNYDVYDSRELAIILCWIPLLTIPYIYSGKKIIYKAGVIICLIESFMGICHWLILKGPLTASSMFVLSNTNYNEAKEFIELKFNIRMLMIIPFIVLFILAIKKTPDITSHPKRNYVAGVVLLFSFIFIGENLVNGRLVRKGIPETTKALISYFEEMKSYSALEKRTIMNVEARAHYKEDEQHVFVLIIGESCNRNHLSLYGYKRKTNPKLERRNDIIVYKNVVSPHSNTLSAVLAFITESNMDNKMPIDKSISLIDVFHSAGFKTFWLSNQPPLGVWDSPVFNFAETADEVRFMNNDGNSSFENTYIKSFDDKLFAPFAKALQEKAKNKFIVLHLMGSHSSYGKRYPSAFDVFNSNTTKKQQLINEYDNSVLYNDFIVDSLLNLIGSFANAEPNAVCSSIYLSDHGENVYDEKDNVGHDYSGSLPKANVEVPFIVWLSAKYNEANPDMLKSIEANSNAPFVTDDLFHAALDLNQIECNNFEKQRSIFNAEFNPKRVRILEDGLDYDLK